MFAQVGGTLSGGDPVHRAPKRLSNERDIFGGLVFSRRGEPRLVRSVRHSRAVSTPPVRSVHPMDPIGSVGRGWLMAASHPRRDLKLNIIPLSWCSAMWQCAIQSPGFVTSRRMSTVSPVRTRRCLPD